MPESLKIRRKKANVTHLKVCYIGVIFIKEGYSHESY
jgi:hypothetical protein